MCKKNQKKIKNKNNTKEDKINQDTHPQISVKRDLIHRQKRPNTEAKETYKSKRDLAKIDAVRSRRVSKET